MQSCKHESWVSIAKFLMEEVPVLLSSDKVKDIKDVIYTVFSSLPSNFSDFIKWVVEVRRQEDGTQKLSEEEKGRLAVKVLVFFCIHFFPYTGYLCSFVDGVADSWFIVFQFYSSCLSLPEWITSI